MKRTIAWILMLCLCICILSGCGEDTPAPGTGESTGQTTAPEATAAPTEPQIRWETQTVYLCVSSSTKFFDGHGTVGTEYEYDEYGNKIKSWYLSGGERTGTYDEYEYDEWGNLVKDYYHSAEYEALCGYNLYTYDEAGRLLTDISYELTGEVSYECVYTYDEEGWLTGEKVTYYSWDPDKISEEVVVYNESHTQATRYFYENGEKNSWYHEEVYDDQGRIVSMNRVNEDGTWGSSREYFYDEQGRISKEVYNTSSDMQADYNVYYTYDENGCLVKDLVDYYYGDETTYIYEAFEILVPVTE